MKARILEEFSDEKYKKLYKSLYVHAVGLVGGVGLVIDVGIGPKDLVSETFEEFFSSPTRLGWHPDKGPLQPFLKQVLRNNFLDHKRRDGKVLVPMKSELLSTSPSNAADPEAQGEAALMAAQLRELIKGRKDENELADFITASEVLGEDCRLSKINQQMADLLGVSAREVVNRRKRLMSATKEWYEKRKEESPRTIRQCRGTASRTNRSSGD